MMKPGLYIHVPFCLSKCPYCTFYSVTDTRRKAQYLKAAAWEMSLYQDIFPAVDTIYVGGGTPSLLSSGEMEVLLDAARRTFASRAMMVMEIEPLLNMVATMPVGPAGCMAMPTSCGE